MVDPSFTFYAENLRGGLFGGFLSAGAFLLTMKTFIVIQIKEKVYDEDYYIEMHQEKNGEQLYRPLCRLSNALFWGVLLCLVASFAQYTIGLLEATWSMVICLVLACLATVALFVCMIFCYLNIRQLYTYAAQKHDARRLITSLPKATDETKIETDPTR